MATYYVRKTGNDSTGSGSTSAPWLTLNKAQSVMVSGDTCLIGDGTYNEDMGPGYCRFNKSGLTWQGENGTASAVIVTGATSATTNTLIVSVTGVTFRHLTFVNRVIGANNAVRSITAISVTFDQCHFDQSATDGSTQTFGGMFDPDTGTTQTLMFTACTATPLDNRFTPISLAATGAGVINATFTDCEFDGGYNALNLNGVTDCDIDGGTFTSQFTSAIKIGADSHTGGQPSTVTITGATVDMTGATSGHGVMVGNGAINCVIDGCTITAYDYGIVLKEHGYSGGGCEVKNCTITGGTLAPIFVKAARNVNIHDNVLTAPAFYAFTADAGDTGNKVENVTFIRNHLIAQAAANALYWPAAGDQGGGVCDYNRYQIDGSGDFGWVQTTDNIADIPALRAAWADYEAGTNDDHSMYGMDYVAADAGDTFEARRVRTFEVW